jgi:chloramphenicol O-acetyltransferase type B
MENPFGSWLESQVIRDHLTNPNIEAGDYTIVGGNPAKPIRRRFNDEQVSMLQAMQWWDWPLPRLQAAMSLLCSGDIPALYQHWQQECAS